MTGPIRRFADAAAAHGRAARPARARGARWGVAALLVGASCAGLQPRRAAARDRWSIAAERIYVDPESPPIERGWIRIHAGTIEAVGSSAADGPPGARVEAGCSGGVVVAGLHNSHVHLTSDTLGRADDKPAADLERSLRRMLTRYGFTTVLDTGSHLANTVALRQRIERGEIRGPTIFTAGAPLYPENGIPFYLRDLPPEVLQRLPQPASAAEAVAAVTGNLARGANASKLFVATPQRSGKIRRMRPEIARAAAAATHAHGGLVLAHPTNPRGVREAVAAGVDIIVHTTIQPPGSSWSEVLIAEMVAHDVAVVPTLKLWDYELVRHRAPDSALRSALEDSIAELRTFASAGGEVLFGTDVGYMTDFNPTDEYAFMARAGLSPMQILASLTTAPARRYGAARRRGRVRAGLEADLTVLRRDPASDVRRFGDVQCTIAGGQAVFVRGESTR